MNEIIKDFYSGYEGEPEIQFIKVDANGDYETIRIWSGFFDDIMTKIEPSEKGWSGLAYYYNLAIGWYTKSPWKIPDLDEIINQFSHLSAEAFRFNESKKICLEIYRLLKIAKTNNESISISEE